jgi:hypothetical protein
MELNYYLQNGTQILLGQAFTDAEGNKYPSNWLELTTATEQSAIGITTAPAEITATPITPVPTFDENKASKKAAILNECNVSCIAGFLSSALGTDHLYASQVLDQMNLNANVVDSLLPHPVGWTTMHVCQEVSTGEWAYRAHTAAQIQQAGSDVKAGILTALLRNAILQSQIDLATTQPQLDAIVW